HRFDIVERSRHVMFRPNILTNSYADFFSVDVERLDAVGRREIAVFVKNIVSRQKRFVSSADWLALLEQSGGVMKRFTAPFVAIDKADQQRRVSHASVQFV